MWTDLSSPVVSARADPLAAWERNTGAIGSAVTPPVLADLLFREGVGVRLNPDLRPERVRWEIEGGLRQELGILAGASVSVRGFKGEVGDMVLWGLSPAYGFVWTPQNFDVRREGGEFSLSVRPFHQLAITGSGTIASVTRDVPNGSQVLYRPLGTAEAGVLWQPGPWSFDARWHYIGIRYPNSSGINPSRHSASSTPRSSAHHPVLPCAAKSTISRIAARIHCRVPQSWVQLPSRPLGTP